jgi:hypothetical protein
MPVAVMLLREDGADVFAPVFVCDYCGERITRYGNFEYMVKAPDDLRRGEYVGVPMVLYTHKHCSTLLRQVFASKLQPGESWHCDELAALPRFLSQDFGRRAWFEDSIGPAEPVLHELRELVRWTSDPRARDAAQRMLKRMGAKGV